jgi:hypothetical protein
MIPESILERDITAEAERFIEADLVYYPSGTSALVISWNHILLDARGTTLLFSHLNSISEQGAIELSNLFPEKEKKPNIIRYIFNMYKVKAFIRKSSRPPISAVAAGKDLSVQKLTSTKIISFGIDDSKKINENAVKTGSRFGPTLFFIACCSKVINFLQKNRNMPGDLWLPVPYDGRLKGAQGPLISNCVHFLFYRLTDSVLQQVPQTVKNLQEQMTSQIKRRMPQRYTMFLNMMRHIPLWLYYFLISRTGKGVMASFLYTSTGDNFNELRSLFGENIRSINLIPALTYPPGLTFVFLKHDETLHINIAYSPDIITNNELFLIEEKLKETLLYNY